MLVGQKEKNEHGGEVCKENIWIIYLLRWSTSLHTYAGPHDFTYLKRLFQTGLRELHDGRGTLSTAEEVKSQRIALA